ncbi:hypothetical protein [Bradyrhizobium sp. 2TAF24]|uniref:hypothetical protein n=1 Tax=Bradyrhizobium sp. 2TAF24 TaxID=3233011 RepID=UPI003F8FE074
MGGDNAKDPCEEAGLAWINGLMALKKAYKALADAEASHDPDSIETASADAREKHDAFNKAREAVKKHCDGPRTHRWPLGNGIEVQVDPDDDLTINQYRALMILIGLGKTATEGTLIILDPKEAPRPPAFEPNKKLGGTYVYEDDGGDKRDIITIYDWNHKGDLFAMPQLKLLLKHEMGHRVRRLLDDPARKNDDHKTGKELWDEFWNGSTGDKPNSTPTAKGGKMPNDYAGHTAGEGFAVCFELYYDKEPLDDAVKKKLEEIMKLL